MFPKIGVPPNHPMFNRVFHYKPSILGYHYFRKHPYQTEDLRRGFYLCGRLLSLIHLGLQSSWHREVRHEFLGQKIHGSIVIRATTPVNWHSYFQVPLFFLVNSIKMLDFLHVTCWFTGVYTFMRNVRKIIQSILFRKANLNANPTGVMSFTQKCFEDLMKNKIL